MAGTHTPAVGTHSASTQLCMDLSYRHFHRPETARVLRSNQDKYKNGQSGCVKHKIEMDPCARAPASSSASPARRTARTR